MWPGSGEDLGRRPVRRAFDGPEPPAEAVEHRVVAGRPRGRDHTTFRGGHDVRSQGPTVERCDGDLDGHGSSVPPPRWVASRRLIYSWGV